VLLLIEKDLLILYVFSSPKNQFSALYIFVQSIYCNKMDNKCYVRFNTIRIEKKQNMESLILK